MLRFSSIYWLMPCLLGALFSGSMQAQCTVDAGQAVIGCSGSTVTLDVTPSGGGTAPFSYSWSPSTGLSSTAVADPVLTIPYGASSYTVTVTDASGCVAISTVDVNGFDPVQAEIDIAPGPNVCPSQTVVFTDESGSMGDPMNGTNKRVWTVGPGPGWTLVSGTLGSMNGQPGDPDLWTSGTAVVSLQFLDPGNATVSLDVASACGASAASTSLNIGTTPAQPIVASNSPVCSGQTLSLSAAPINGISYAWSGPGGFSSTQPSVTIPSANASQIGLWTVTASNGTCASAPSSVTVQVVQPPSISVSPGFSAYCAGGSSTLEASGAVNYTWYIGGSIVGTGDTQTVIPAATTTYTVTGTVNGCSGFASATILVHPLPTAGFEAPTEACVGEEIQFNNSTFGANSAQWSFGDAGTSAATSPLHAFQAPGTYPVSLVAATNAGCADTLETAITIWEVPEAAFTMDVAAGCAPLSVDFSNASLGSGLVADWDLGGANSADSDPSHDFGSPGTHGIALVVSNGGGCSDTAWASVEVFPTPIASFLLPVAHACEAPFALEPMNTSSGAVDYAWSFGNGGVSTDPLPTVTYEEPGAYDIQLITTNAYACSDTAISTFTVYPTLSVSFTIDGSEVCAGAPVVFTNNSIGATDVLWHFGDGSTSDSFDAEHMYSVTGMHHVMLEVVGEGACADSAMMIDAVNVLASPHAEFHMDVEGGFDNVVQLTNASTDADHYIWDLGDGVISTESSILQPFSSDGGEWLICLSAYNSTVCADTTCKTLTLPSAPQLYAPNTFTPDGDGINDIFNLVLDGFTDWSFDMQVFDRWGELIHESRDRYQGWDGRSKGSEAPDGVYVWRVQLQKAGESRTYPGHITLVR